MIVKEELRLTAQWDKTFPKSEKANHSKVTFVNRYGITLAADLYAPKNAEGKLPAIAVCGPFGAVKEQCSGLYDANRTDNTEISEEISRFRRFFTQIIEDTLPVDPALFPAWVGKWVRFFAVWVKVWVRPLAGIKRGVRKNRIGSRV